MAALTLQYLVGIKREIRDALRDVIKAIPDERLAGTNVTLEWPLTPVSYPAIFITYSEGPVQNIGVGHIEYDDTNSVVKAWKYHGQINFNVVAMSPFERDVIAATLVNIIGMGDAIPEFKSFHEDINDADFVVMNLMTDRIIPGGESQGPVPWENANEQLYTRSYSLEVFGEFFTDPQTAQLISISEIDLYPYQPGDPIPTGSTNPLDDNTFVP